MLSLDADVADSLADDVDISCQMSDSFSDQEPQTNKPEIKPYRRAGPDVDNVKVFIHGHLRGTSTSHHAIID